MRIKSLPVAILAALSLLSCRAVTQQPVESTELRVPGEGDEIICHVRGLASTYGLKFSFGTHAASYGQQATFRLLGDGFEIAFYNLEDESTYILRLYATSPNNEGVERGRQVYSQFSQAVVGPKPHNCVEHPPSAEEQGHDLASTRTG